MLPWREILAPGASSFNASHHLIVWAAATLRHCPIYIFARHFDATTLAMDTVLSIDDKVLCANAIIFSLLFLLPPLPVAFVFL